MNQQASKTGSLSKTHNIVYCGMFAVLITLGAFIKIPIPVVPFTLQFFFTAMAGLVLGSKLGAMSVGIYTLLGLVGLPVFSSGGGPHYIFVPSFGYILGFIFGSYLAGRIVEVAKKKTFATYLLANFANLFVVYALGMIYYFVISNYVIDSPIGIWPLFLYCFFLAVPGDICLCILASILAKKLETVQLWS